MLHIYYYSILTMWPCIILYLNDNHNFTCWLSVGFVTFPADLFIRNVALSATKNLILNLIKPTVQKCVMYVKCTTHLRYLSCTLKCHYLTSACVCKILIHDQLDVLSLAAFPPGYQKQGGPPSLSKSA